MQRSPELFARDSEWNDLADFASQRGPGTKLAIVRGRRRQGKFIPPPPAGAVNQRFYYQAVEEEQSQALAGFGRALGEYMRVPGGRLALDSWDDAFRALGEAKNTAARHTVGDLRRLERIRELVAAKNASAAKARLLLFSANGFETTLASESAKRNDVELIDAGRLYSGE